MNFVVSNFVLLQKYLTPPPKKTFTNTLFVKYKSDLNEKLKIYGITSSSVSTIVSEQYS